MRLYDAHNHLQDKRLAPWLDEIVESIPRLAIERMVVNGTKESDWDDVASLARQHRWIQPSFGLHPWYVRQRSPTWLDTLRRLLSEFPSAAVGEIGLDRWIPDADLPAQEEVFGAQLELAATLHRPVSIHCLKAWGKLEVMLSSARMPLHGFLLHSYSGPAEMVPRFASLGAYFSFSPHFTHERKSRQAQVFASVPLDRLLAETDAPDMGPPDALNPRPLRDLEGKPLNHPANLELSYRALAAVRGLSPAEIALRFEENFLRLFDARPQAPIRP